MYRYFTWTDDIRTQSGDLCLADKVFRSQFRGITRMPLLGEPLVLGVYEWIVGPDWTTPSCASKTGGG